MRITTLAAAVAAGLAMAGGAAADALDRITETGVIRLGVRTDAAPFSYISDIGEPSGLAVELCRDVAISIKRERGLAALEVAYVPVSAASRFEALRSGEIDLLCGPTSATLARRAEIDFSIPYFIDGASAAFRQGALEHVEDLTDERVGVLGDTTTEALLPDLLAEQGATGDIVTFSRHEAGLAALTGGEIDAYFADQGILYRRVLELGASSGLVVAPAQYSFEPYALAMKRGETGLRLEVDRSLSRVFRSGRIFALVNAAMGEVELSDLSIFVYDVVALPD